MPTKTIKLLLASLPLCTFAASAVAPIHTRIALVIGNSAYASAPLLNPANDAKAMSQTLRNLGFEVVEVRDASMAQMKSAIAKVSGQLKGKEGVGLLYYAGHGLQLNNHNYMVPVDAKMRQATDVPQQSVDLSTVVDAFKTAGNRMNIIVLDACRNNPFGANASGKGLAPMDAPSGTFLAYATAPGNVAEDGDEKSGNGLYTQYLLQEIKKPQARIEDIFKRVRFNVRQKSDGRQIPWESTSLEDDFFFADGTLSKAQKANPLDLQSSFDEEKQLWARIKESRNADDFYNFIQKYPNGTITEAAQAKISQLNRTNLVVQGASADGKAQPYSVPKFRLGDEYHTRRTTIIASAPATQNVDSYKVVSINNGEVTVEGEIETSPGKTTRMTTFYTPEGGNTGNSYMRFDPPQFHAPDGLLQTGRQWRIAYQAMPTAMIPSAPARPVTGEGKILTREKVTVQAGTYDTFKIQSNTFQDVAGKISETDCMIWVTADLPAPVKTECTVKSGTNLRFTLELTRFTRGS